MSALLSLDGVTVTRAGKTVLAGVDLALYQGERLAVIGPNGSGKTTLLRTIVGLEQPAGGRIRLFGEDCSNERQFRRFRPRIGFLFQDSDDQLFCPSVIEDVSFGPLNIGCSHAQSMERAQAALDDLGIGHLADRISHRLSGGEKRLVCLAGLLAMNPEVLMLDEPTNGVDADNGQLLLAALNAYRGAMLLVSHDVEFVSQLATRAVVAQHGRLLSAEIHEHVHFHHHRHVHTKPE
ncbi:cobalt/nickel transport system ATP-binding protein [Kaistia soli DSM 19436]|uniref:Cobalt/nickel transport system ATP-binding protein n=1 Tax=Kaistia soli DSM 19436 TaxID=1122133 RepID=A0A1M5I917_9HYPH|nr:ABC transporter ATP-binding protein [Kaistia soli]SHG24731.1 cobalt/nickel transport system ATP-binding protein [Kaistia soli DSM 19436]